MTLQDLLDATSAYPWAIGAYFVLPPAFAFLAGYTEESAGRLTARDYALSVLIYMVAIPGIVSLVLVGYQLFFIRGNLLEVNLLLYFLPIVSMVATFVLIRRCASFDRLPGFDRLSGLMMLIGLSFLVVLVLYRTRFLVGFFGSLESLLVIGVVVFLAFQYAARKLTGPDRD